MVEIDIPEEVVQGLISALDDFKNGRYTVVEKEVTLPDRTHTPIGAQDDALKEDIPEEHGHPIHDIDRAKFGRRG